MTAGVLQSEVLKLGTIRTTRWLAVLAVLFTVLTTTVIGFGTTSAELHSEAGVRNVLAQGGFAAGILALILGVVVSAGEYRHGTIAPTLLITPGRSRVVGTQVVAHTLIGLLVGAAAAAGCFAIGLPLLAARGVEPPISGGDLAAIAVGGVVFAGLSAALGSALGSLLGNQVAAVALACVVMFVLEPVLTLMIPGYQQYSLVGVRTSIIGGSAQMSGDPDGAVMPALQALLLWCAYTALLTGAAIAVARRREIA